MGEERPHRFGNYQLIRRLAQGGMAEIWLARDEEQPDRDVVIKRIHQHLVADDQFLMMFLDEAKIAARLDHPGCVQIFDLGCTGGSYYLAMEYIHGEDIRSIARQARKKSVPLPRKLAVEIVAGAAEGLHYAHELRDSATGLALNVVHRDVSPQNILVTYSGDVKIVDFGIAKAADQANRTQAGVLKGKYAYMSPEQVLGSTLDRRSDVFALGVLLYELTTGKRLFKAATELESMRRISRGIVVPPTVASPGFPPKLETIVLKALAKDRDERYDSADTLQKELRRFLAAHSCSVARSDVSQFMNSLFADRIEAEKAASARGDEEAFLRARFGEDSVSSGKKKPASEIDIEIDIDDSDEEDLEAPTADPSEQLEVPTHPGLSPPDLRAAPQRQGSPSSSPAFEAATNPTISLRGPTVDPRRPSGEVGSPDEQGNAAFDRTDPIRTYSDVFPAGPPPDAERRGPAAASAKAEQPKAPTLGSAADYSTTVSGMNTAPGISVDRALDYLPPSEPTMTEGTPLVREKPRNTAVFAILGVAVIVAGAILATTLIRSGEAESATGSDAAAGGSILGVEAGTEGGLDPGAEPVDPGGEVAGSGEVTGAPSAEDSFPGTETPPAAESDPAIAQVAGQPEPEGDNLAGREPEPTEPPAVESTEAAEGDSTDSQPQVAATEPAARRPETPAQRRPPRQTTPAAPRPGNVTIRADAPGVVLLNGEEIGPLPLQRHSLPPGNYTFLVRGEEVEQRVPVRVAAGQAVTRAVSLKMGLLRVSVRPWAEIYVDGRHIGTTPFAPVRIPAGRHTLEARNPDLDVRRRVPFVMEPDGEVLLTLDLLEE